MAQITLNSSGVASSGSLLLQTNGTTTQATVDTSGNLGLGVTPSAWGTSGLVARALQLGGNAALWTRTDLTASMYLSANMYALSDGSFKYLATDYSTVYQQYQGQHRWFYAPSGTAGNAITFTQAMTLDASGNLGVGTTSPARRLHVSATNDCLARVESTTGGSAYLELLSSTQSLASYSRVQGKYGSSVDWEIGGGAGTVSTLIMATGGSERARIDSSGNLLVGTTSNPAGVKLVIGGTSGTARVEPVTDNVGYIGEGSYRWQAVYAVNGTIQTSDGREKNTIQDSNLGLSFVNSLRPVSYKWNVGENVVTYDEEGKEVVTPRAGVRTHYGFIAQEVKAAIPDGVDFGGFVQEPNDGMMSLRYHEFIGPLVKAIQEQQAIINSLTARVEALENK